jgi:hypothetical protein
VVFSGEFAQDRKHAADFAAEARQKKSVSVDPKRGNRAQIVGSSAASEAQQTAAGIITGTVLDTNREVLQGARVTVAGQSSSAIRTLESGSNGEFAFTGLCPDTYKLTVAAPGLNTFTTSEISLHEGETRLVSVMLSVFGGATSVTVSGNKQEMAEEQVQIAVRQRIGGISRTFTALMTGMHRPCGRNRNSS